MIIFHFHMKMCFGGFRSTTCFTVKTVTKIWAEEITWNIGGTCNSKDLGKYENNKEDTDECCVAKGQDEFVITCKDSYGDGWHGGYLEINGKKYCASFESGTKFTDKLSLDGSSEPGLITINLFPHNLNHYNSFSMVCENLIHIIITL